MYAASTHLHLLRHTLLTTKEMIQREDETSLLLYDTYRIELANHKIDSGFQFYLATVLRAHRKYLYRRVVGCQS